VRCSIEILSVLCWELRDSCGTPLDCHCPTLAAVEAELGEMTVNEDPVVNEVVIARVGPCAVVYCAGCGQVWADGVHLTPDELTLPAGNGWRVDPHAGMAWCPDCVHQAPAPDPLTVPVPVVDGQLPLPRIS